MKVPVYRPLLVFLTGLLLVCAPGKGQFGGGANSRIEGKVKFMPIPYMNYDRSMGFTLGAVPMLMFNPSEKDTISPSSLVGAVGTYSTNKTWFAMGFGMFFLKEDRWRLTTAGGTGNVNFQFFFDGFGGVWIPYSTEAKFFMLRVERKIYKKLYGGVSYNFADVISSSKDFPVADSTTLHGIGLNLSLDMRDNPHYPRSGSLSEVKYNAFPEFFGNEDQNQKIELSTNHYFSARQDKDVVAARLYGGFGIGEIAFAQQFIVSRKDIRGYTQGAYRGNNMLAVQGEYRWNFLKRWGAISYAGLATVFDAINESDNWKPLPAVGTGIRFKAFTETNFNVGIDIAAGIDDWGIYFQIGEVF